MTGTSSLRAQTGWCSPAKTGWSASSGPWTGRRWTSSTYFPPGNSFGWGCCPAPGAALRRHGISADLCPEVHTTQGLADALLERVSPGEPVRLFRSQLGSRELYRRLAERFPVEDVPLYALRPDNTDPAALQARLEEADYLLLSSASGVDFLLDTGAALPPSLTCVCIGPVTAKALAARSTAPFLTAPNISAESVVQLVSQHCYTSKN